MEGESMSKWKELRAQDFCFYVTDGTHDSPKRRTKGYYLLTSKHIGKDTLDFESAYKISEDDYLKIIERSKVEQYDILYSMIGTIGNVHIVKEDKVNFAVKNMGIFKFNGDYLHSLWMYYWLKSTKATEYIKSRLSGSTQQYITLSSLRDFPISIPEIDIMRLITGILSSLDAKIETNNKLNEKLEEMAQAIFKSWFVDFEPFKDKPFHDTELGMIPEGWEVKRLCDIVDNIGGYSYKGNELKESTTAMCTIKNFERNGGFKIDGYKEIIPSDKLKASQELSLFDVVVAHTDLTQNAEVIGNPAIILSKSNYDRIIFSMDLTKVISKNMNVSKSLLYCILRNKRFKNHALGYVNGTTVLHMSKKAVPDYMLAFPKDSAILVSLSKCFDSIFGRMHEIYEENDRLASLRDTLLPRLMSGELIV